jgi:hypothetical protein
VFRRPVRFVLEVSWRMPYYYIRGCPSRRFYFYDPQHHTPRIVRSLETIWARMYTRSLWLTTAVGTIALGRPLVLPRDSETQLLKAASEFQSEEVANLVRRYGPPDPAHLKRVSNWLDYEERMNFIVAYFMAYQMIRKMFDEPRFKPRRSRRKLHLLDPLGNLRIDRVTL